jgi:quercetin dioxygenase-like cupin family protein
MIIRPVSEIESKTITPLEHEGKKVDVGNVKMKWLTHKDMEGQKIDFAVRHVTLESGSTIPSHEHEHCHTVYVMKGKLEVTSGDETKEIGPDTLYYVPPFEPHSAKSIGNEPAVIICCINCIGEGENCAP